MKLLKPEERKTVIYAEGYFGSPASKTALSVIRYSPDEITAVIDSNHAGKTVEEVTGFGGEIPVAADIEEALDLQPNQLLIGTALPGGKLDEDWIEDFAAALRKGVTLVHGLHTDLSEIPELKRAAKTGNAAIVNLRGIEKEPDLPPKEGLDWEGEIVLTVGTDCHTGKMTVAKELSQALKDKGIRAKMAATGQTGIYLEGSGVPIDAVKSDFIAGAVHQLIASEIEDDLEVLVVEGQGALGHPAYSGVTAGIIHGAQPDGMILCHEPGRETIDGYERVEIPSIKEIVETHNRFAGLIKDAGIIGFALDCHKLDEEETKKKIKEIQNSVRLPATDVIKFGCSPLIRSVEELTYSYD